MRKLPIFFLAMIAFFGCGKSDSRPKDPLPQALESGTWRINSFWDNSIDHTTQFSGYTFSFLDNGQVKAIKNASDITGSWSYQYVQAVLKMTISFGTTPDLLDLNGSWDVNAVFPTEVGLIRHNNPTGTDAVSFLKN